METMILDAVCLSFVVGFGGGGGGEKARQIYVISLYSLPPFTFSFHFKNLHSCKKIFVYLQ